MSEQVEMQGAGSATPPKSGKIDGEDKEQVVHEGKMSAESSSPSHGSGTTTRMSRMPSLQQISSRLHHPGPLSTQPASTSNIERSSAPSPNAKPESPALSRPKLAVDAASHTVSGPASIIASPSGRLKLPPSAMMRSLSTSSAPPFSGTNDLKLDTGEVGVRSATPNPSSAVPIRVDNSRSMSREHSREGYIKGYKDVPSLSAIRARIGAIKASPLGEGTKAEEVKSPIPAIDPTSTTERTDHAEQQVTAPPQPSDPMPSATSSASSDQHPEGKKQQHPLKHSWTLYFDSKNFKPDPSFVSVKEGETLGDYEKSLVTVGRFDTVEGFARHLNNIRLPSHLARNSNYHMFKNGIRPMWEDPANANGGKWVILFRSAPYLLDFAWANLTMALVGEILDPEDKVCGVVASSRPKVDRIQVWTRSRDDVEGINLIGRRILESMSLEGRECENMSMDFQYNAGNSAPAPGLFLHIPFSNRSASFALSSQSPTRLGVPTPGMATGRLGLLHHPSLPSLPKTPVCPQSPAPTGGEGDKAETMAPPPLPHSAPAQRRGSSSHSTMGSSAALGEPTSPRGNHAQLAKAK